MICFSMFFIVQAQKLMIDSRNSPINTQELKQFNQEFSIWFIYQQTSDSEIQDLFMITIDNHYLLRIQLNVERIVIINQDQIIVIEYNSQNRTQWIHLIISQNQNFQNDTFFINFELPFQQKYLINTERLNILDGLSLIMTQFNRKQFCLIYDSVVDKFQPIIRSTNMQSLIHQKEFMLSQYHADSYFEILLKKYKTKYRYSILLSIFYSDINILEIQEIDDELYICAYQCDNIQGLYQNYKWFTILIKFQKNQMELQISFVDFYQQMSIKNIIGEHIFYEVSISTQKTNYQYMKFTEYFNFKNVDLMNQKDLQSLNNCQIGLNSYYIQENNTCGDYIDLDQIKIFPALNDTQIDINNYFKVQKQQLQIGEAIQRQLITRVSNYNNIPFIDYNTEEIYNFLKEPFILWKNQQFSVCQQNYFGKYCTKFIRKCLVAQNYKCIYCADGYILIQSQCKKCPQGCLLCISDKYQLKCLLPEKEYYINKHGQAKICNCEYCSAEGQCLSLQQMFDQREQCFKQTKCILKKCQQSIWQYFSLISQKCEELSEDQLNLIQFKAYEKQQYHQLGQIEYIILQIHEIYGDTILRNIQLQNYHLSAQLYESLNIIQMKQLHNYIQNYLSKLNLVCVKKQLISNKQIICQEFAPKQQSRCLQLPCLYKLNITDINYYLGYKNYIEHNNFTYDNLYDLLESVQDIGVNFDQVNLDINFILFNINAKNIVAYELALYQNLSSFYQTKIQIRLKFTSQFNLEQEDVLIKFKADNLIIENQTINFNLKLSLDINFIKIQNVTIEQNVRFIMYFINSQYILFDSIQMNGVFHLTLFQAQKVDFINYISTEGTQTQIYVVQSEFFSISYSNLFYSDRCVFLYNEEKIKLITFFNVIFSFHELNKKYLLSINKLDQLRLQNVTFIGHSNEDVVIFQIIAKKVSFINININITKIFSTVIFNINSNEFELIDFKISLQIINMSQLLVIITSSLSIYQLKIIQNKGISNFQIQPQNQGNSALISFRVGQSCYIQDLKVDGLYLQNTQLLAIFALSSINIFKMELRNINIVFIYDSSYIFLMSPNYENILLYGISLYNISVEVEYNWKFNLIEVFKGGYAIFKDLQIRQIHSNTNSIKNNQQFIMQIETQFLQFQTFHIENCTKLYFINILSTQFFLSELIYKDNHQDIIFFLENNNPELMEIKNCIFNLLKSTILFVDSSKKIRIGIKDIQINLIEIGCNFQIIGLPIQVYIENMNIAYINQNLENISNYWLSVFEIKFATIIMKNLIATNLKQPLIHSAFYSKVNLYDISLNDFSFQDHANEYDVFFILNSSLIIQQLNIYSILNFHRIFSLNNGDFYLQDIKIHNIINIDNIMKFETDDKRARIIMRDIYIYKFQGKQVFRFNIKQKESIQFNNLFITQSDKFNTDGALKKLILNNSKIIQIDNLLIQQTQVLLSNSEITYNSQLQFKQIQLDRSLLYNIQTQESVYQTQFIMTLSLNRFNTLQSVIIQNTEQIIYEIYLNKQNYFYVPSGQRLTEYKKLNLQSLQYQQVYRGLYLVTQGFLFGQTNYELQCHQIQYYNDKQIDNDFFNFMIIAGFNDISEYIFIVNPHNHNFTVFKIQCSSDIHNQIIQLQYRVKSFPCQLGEYLYQNQCLECNPKLNQFSVTFNATKCSFIDQKIQAARKGLIKLEKKYWRYKLDSHIIEYCGSDHCNGGWIPGDQSCRTSRVGALCVECDLYNIRGDGYFTKSNDQCQLCSESYLKFILQLLCAVAWQLLIVLSGYYSNNKLSKQYLMFRVGFRQFYQILYRQSIDQPSIFIKMFVNYMFMLFVIRQSLDLNGFIFVCNINVINNPGLVLQAQLDCLLSKFFKLEIIYSQFLFQFLLVFFILSLTIIIYFIILYFRLIKHSFGFILYFTEGIIIYNIKIILDISCRLLSYTVASGQKWVKQNQQYLFYSEEHISMIQCIIPISAMLLVSPIIFPLVMKNLSIFNRQARRIYAVYYQQFKNVFFYWEYIILYTKYALIIFQIIDSQSNLQAFVIIWMLITFSLNYKPYYLQNLNQFELNLLLFYGFQLNLIKMVEYKDICIILLNLFIFLYFVIRIYRCHNLINFEKKIYWKQKIISFIPVTRQFISLYRNQRQQANKQMLINIIYTKILNKNQNQFTKQRLFTETEIELSVILNLQRTQTAYPSRQEPSNK